MPALFLLVHMANTIVHPSAQEGREGVILKIHWGKGATVSKEEAFCPRDPNNVGGATQA